MAGTPIWKVYTDEGEYIGSTKSPWYAAMLIAGMGEGTIRHGHQDICWAEGLEKIEADETLTELAIAKDRIKELEKQLRENNR